MACVLDQVTYLDSEPKSLWYMLASFFPDYLPFGTELDYISQHPLQLDAALCLSCGQ